MLCLTIAFSYVAYGYLVLHVFCWLVVCDCADFDFVCGILVSVVGC